MEAQRSAFTGKTQRGLPERAKINTLILRHGGPITELQVIEGRQLREIL